MGYARRFGLAAVAAAVVAGGSASIGQGPASLHKVFAKAACTDADSGPSSISAGGSAEIENYCAFGYMPAQLNNAPPGSSSHDVYIYQGRVGQGTLISHNNGTDSTFVTDPSCNNYFYAYAAYSLSGNRYGANTNTIYVGC